MDALTEWAAFAGIYSQEARRTRAGTEYDEHVDILLGAIEKLSDGAKAELVALLEEVRP